MAWFGHEESLRLRIEKVKAVKWRQWILLPSIPTTIAALIANTIAVITALGSFANYSNAYTGIKFSFYDLPDGPEGSNSNNNNNIRSKIVTAVSLEIVMLVVLWAETIYFAIFFHRDDRVHKRCAIQASLSALLIAIAAAMKVTQDELAVMPLDLNNLSEMRTHRPDLTAKQFDAAYRSWRGAVIEDTGLIAFIISVVDATIHLIVILFWIWLLPARHRLPNRYEPVVRPKKKKQMKNVLLFGGQEHGNVSEYELLSSATMVGTGPLEAVFQEHERVRLSGLNKTSNMPAKAAQGPYPPSPSPRGPQFEPTIRYWMVNPLLDGAWWITAIALAFFIVDPVLEIVFYTLNRKYDLRCRWYCYLAFAYPWPIILWAAVIILLLQLKIPFNRPVFPKGPRLDVVITIAALPFIPLWLLVHIMRFAEFSIDSGSEYTNYIESDPGRSSAYGTIAILKILELSFALIMAIGLSVMGHTVYKFYKAGRDSKK